MRVLHDVSAETRHVLQRLSKESQHHRVRQRAHCLLLSCQGFNTTALRAIFSVHRLTIYHWVDAWEAHHCAGLYDRSCTCSVRVIPSPANQVKSLHFTTV